jgi:hypothetical protein
VDAPNARHATNIAQAAFLAAQAVYSEDFEPMPLRNSYEASVRMTALHLEVAADALGLNVHDTETWQTLGVHDIIRRVRDRHMTESARSELERLRD